jgi:hypothetical protein
MRKIAEVSGTSRNPDKVRCYFLLRRDHSRAAADVDGICRRTYRDATKSMIEGGVAGRIRLCDGNRIPDAISVRLQLAAHHQSEFLRGINGFISHKK